MHPYIAVSLLAGLRPEEVRALEWDRVHVDAPTPYIEVWRSIRLGGDVKTEKSRRTLAISGYVVHVLAIQAAHVERARAAAGIEWQENNLVFPSLLGRPQDAHNVRRMFRDALSNVEDLDPEKWTPYELRHSFVSILSHSGLAIEEISRLMGHNGTRVTELVYHHELRPILESGASIMDQVFPGLLGSADVARPT